MQATTTRPKITATADGEGVVSHAGSRLLADVADRTTLTGAACRGAGRAAQAAGPPRSGSGAGRHGGRGRRWCDDDLRRCGAGGSGRVVRAGGVGLDVLAAARPPRHRAAGCGRSGSGRGTGGRLGAARRAVRRAVPAGEGGRPRAARAGDRPGRLDRGLPQREGTGGADVQEDLRVSPDAGVLRQHRRVPRRRSCGAATRAATPPPTTSPCSTPRWRSCPTQHRHGTPILVRADTAGCTREFLAHLRSAARHGGELRVLGRLGDHRARNGPRSPPSRRRVWADAVDADGGHRDGAGLAEITRVLPARALAGYPAGTRVIVRRERPHPGAQLDAFEEARRLALHRVRHRHPRSGSSPTSTPGTARTPGSRTGSAARRTPAWTTSRRRSFAINKPG